MCFSQKLFFDSQQILPPILCLSEILMGIFEEEVFMVKYIQEIAYILAHSC